MNARFTKTQRSPLKALPLHGLSGERTQAEGTLTRSLLHSSPARKLCVLGCASALCTAGFIASAPAAYADSSAGNTDLYVKADDTQLSVSAPTVLDFVSKSDGTLIGPTDTKIVNNSVMSVHVSKIGVTAQGGATLAKTAELGAKADTLSITIKPNEKTAIELADYITAKAPTTATDWNIGKTDSGAATDEIALSYTGKISSFSVLDPATSQQFGQIVWTVAPGNAV